MLFSHCKNCQYLQSIISNLQEENRHLLDQLLTRVSVPPVTPVVVEQPKVKTQHEIAVENGEAEDYGDVE